jgi:serine/threonine protein kinase
MPKQSAIVLDDIPLPPQWIIEITEDGPQQGLIYFSNQLKEISQWTDPRFPLPTGWKENKNNQGISFFVQEASANSNNSPETSSNANISSGSHTARLAPIKDIKTAYNSQNATKPKLPKPRQPNTARTSNRTKPAVVPAKGPENSTVDPRGPAIAKLLAPSQLRLPAQYHPAVDANGFIYFNNDLTQSSQWNDPRAPLPAAWRQQRNLENKTLWLNVVENQESFVDPRVDLPPNYRICSELRGVYYQNDADNTATWADPRDSLPQGWAINVDQQGKVIYINKAAGIEQFNDPRLLPRTKLTAVTEKSENNSGTNSPRTQNLTKIPSSPRNPAAKASQSRGGKPPLPNSLSKAVFSPKHSAPGSKIPSPALSKPNSASKLTPNSENSARILPKRPLHSSSYTSKYQKLQQFAAGAFGRIFEVKNRENQSSFALKEVKLDGKGGNSAAVRNEMALHSSSACIHENIVEFIEGFSTAHSVALVLELCRGGNLHNFIEQHKFRYWCYEKSLEKGVTKPDKSDFDPQRTQFPPYYYIPESIILRWLVQLCSALAQLHEFHVIHKDIKLANCFLALEEQKTAQKFDGSPCQCCENHKNNKINKNYVEFLSDADNFAVKAKKMSSRNPSRPGSGREMAQNPANSAGNKSTVKFPAINKPQIAASSAKNANSAEPSKIPDYPHFHSVYMNYTLKLGDFGLATTVESHQTALKFKGKEEFEGTPCFYAPEQFHNSHIRATMRENEVVGAQNRAENGSNNAEFYKIDCWAVGVILYYLCSLFLPFGEVNTAGNREEMSSQFFAVKKKVCAENPPELPRCYSQELRELIMALLAKKARFRPGMKEVLQSKLCQDFILQNQHK